MIGKPKFDYYCWDLYARVTHFLAEDKSRLDLRAQTLKDIEEDHGEAAKIAEIVSTAIVARHLQTLERLGIDYDLLPRESEILHLKFWDAAFEMLKQRGAIQLATSGKNAGCWVMQLPSDREETDGKRRRLREEPAGGSRRENHRALKRHGHLRRQGHRVPALEIWPAGPRFSLPAVSLRPTASGSHGLQRQTPSEPGAPEFGHAREVFNVIDSRQAYPQQVVVAGLRALGYTEQADHLKHFSYNVVALTPRCALEMGYEIPPEDAKKPYIEVSGRKGQGVKADDLLDQLEASARNEVDARHADTPEAERAAIAHAIAIGALRYFLLRFTRSTVIAFDFKDALSFEGETGPYVQYAVVRVNGILRKGAESNPAVRSA